MKKKVRKNKNKKKDPVEEFFALRDKLPKLTDKQIMVAIHEGRT